MNDFQELTCCNYVTCVTINDRVVLYLSNTKKDNVKIDYPTNFVGEKACEVRVACFDKSDKPCTCQTLPLPVVDEIRYYCDCTVTCSCWKLRLPATCVGENVIISRNENGLTNLHTQKEYEDYVKIDPCFTFHDGYLGREMGNLVVDYENYFMVYYPAYYRKTAFRVDSTGTITKYGKSKEYFGMPFVWEIVSKLVHIKQFTYEITDRKNVAIDLNRIRRLLPDGSTLVVTETIVQPPRYIHMFDCANCGFGSGLD